MADDSAKLDGASPAQSVPEEDDGFLARRVQAGDSRAFEQLARRYLRSVHAVVASYLAEPADVEDAAQDTFLRALDRIHTFDPARPFAPWLYQIARNVARNRRSWLRRRERESRGNAEIRGPGLDPLARLERAEIRREVRAAMDRLPEQQRTAFRLFDVEGYDAAQIARLMGISAGTVRSHVHHARRALRAELAALFEKEGDK